MWLYISLAIAIVGGSIVPFSSRLHATGLWAGKALASPASATIMPCGFQDALTDGWPSMVCLVGTFLPWIGAIVGFLHSWWVPFLSALVAVVVIQTAKRLPAYPHKVEQYLLMLHSHLSRRHANFVRSGDAVRAQAASELRSELEELLEIYLGTWVSVPTWQIAAHAPFGDRKYLLDRGQS